MKHLGSILLSYSNLAIIDTINKLTLEVLHKLQEILYIPKKNKITYYLLETRFWEKLKYQHNHLVWK